MAAAIFELVQRRLAPPARAAVSHGTLVLEIAADELTHVARALKTEFQFDVLLDVTAVDWPAQPIRFEVVHHFYSTLHHVRVRVKCRVSEHAPSVPSLAALHNSARYMERECHDMYGIVFAGNPDLRPILLYEGFVGHPLRKDYPKQQEQPLVPYRNRESHG